MRQEVSTADPKDYYAAGRVLLAHIRVSEVLWKKQDWNGIIKEMRSATQAGERFAKTADPEFRGNLATAWSRLGNAMLQGNKGCAEAMPAFRRAAEWVATLPEVQKRAHYWLTPESAEVRSRCPRCSSIILSSIGTRSFLGSGRW